MNWLNKVFNSLKLTWYYLIQGLIAADKTIVNSQKEDASSNTVITQEQQQKSVLQDLLRGEVTEEVKELRYEMYHVERESRKYEYSGGGHAKKRNELFDYPGKLETSDGLEIKLVQNNSPIVKSLIDEGIVCHGEDVNIDNSFNGKFQINRDVEQEYRVKIERDFIPRFMLERYITKVVVKDADETHVVLDIYVPQYRGQYDNISKLFQSELKKIYEGNSRSDLLSFTSLEFATRNCYGSEDSFVFKYNKPVFHNIIKFDGDYVLRFYCEVEINGEDELAVYYHKETAEKFEKCAPRENATVDFEVLEGLERMKQYDSSEEEALLEEMRNIDGEEN